MKIAVCDDEKEILHDIKKEIENIVSELNVSIDIDAFSNGNELLESGTKYDMLFLDIEMPRINGLELADRYQSLNKKGLLSFLTTHVELSREGYKVKAFRFLNKADFSEDLKEALISGIKIIESRKTIDFYMAEEGVAYLECDDIEYIETSGRKIMVHLQNDSFIANETMKMVVQRMDNPNFYQVHRSYYVNMDRILKCEKQEIVLKSGERILISYRKKKSFLEYYYNWKFERGNG